MAELFNHVFDLDYSQPHQLLAHVVTRIDQSWLRAFRNHRFSFRVWSVSFICLPCVALLFLFVHHMHNTLKSPPPTIPPTAYDSLHMTRDTKYCSRSPILPLNITIETKVIRWYYS